MPSGKEFLETCFSFLVMRQIKIFLNTLSILFTICALAWHGRPVLQKYKAARGLAVKDIACAK